MQALRTELRGARLFAPNSAQAGERVRGNLRLLPTSRVRFGGPRFSLSARFGQTRQDQGRQLAYRLEAA